MLLLDALYINNSGGKVLLDLLVEALYQSKQDVLYLLDDRCRGQYNYLPEASTCYLKASISNRKKFYQTRGSEFSKVICFGNIPPTQPLKAEVFTYFHNINILIQPKSLSLKSRILLKAKGLYIQLLKKNTDYWLVQSENMQQVLQKAFDIPESLIEIYPFYKHTSFIETERSSDSFCYISNGNTHKNHTTLLDAWEKLYKEELLPLLSLTVTNSYPTLQKRIEDMQIRGIRVENKGWVIPTDLYKTHKYLIYPSLAESFGLGLVEAVEAGCEVIGADMAYTYAVVEPMKVFNPVDSNSIYSIVKSVLNEPGKQQQSKVVVKNRLEDLVKKLTS